MNPNNINNKRWGLRCPQWMWPDGFAGHKTIDIFIDQDIEDPDYTRAIKRERRWFFPENTKHIANLRVLQYRRKTVKYATCDLDIIIDDALDKWELGENYCLLKCHPDFANDMVSKSSSMTFMHSCTYPSKDYALFNEMGFLPANLYEDGSLIKAVLLRLILSTKF